MIQSRFLLLAALFLAPAGSRAAGLVPPVTVDSIQAYLKQNGSPASVEGFLAALPEEFRRNYVMMIDSQSTQKADSRNPRILMKSKDGKTIISFNTGPEKEGYNRIEVIGFDDTEKRFKSAEVTFAPGKKATVKTDPPDCKKCHTNDLRPNWDAYNFWAGQLPFNRDQLFKGSLESKLYLSIMDRAPGDSRLRFLRFPPNLRDRLEKEGFVQLPHDETGDGPGVRMFDQLVALNGKKIGGSLRKMPGYDVWKYALASSLNGCGQVAELVPAETKAKNEQYFGGMDYAALEADTRAKQNALRDDKERRQRALFAKILSEPTASGSGPATSGLSGPELDKAVQAELDRRERENREDFNDTDQLTRLRFLLEPEGVEVSRWSMSLSDGLTSSPTYAFADKVNELTAALKAQLDENLPKDFDNAIAKADQYIATDRDNIRAQKKLVETAAPVIETRTRTVLRAKERLAQPAVPTDEDQAERDKAASDLALAEADLKAIEDGVHDAPRVIEKNEAEITRLEERKKNLAVEKEKLKSTADRCATLAELSRAAYLDRDPAVQRSFLEDPRCVLPIVSPAAPVQKMMGELSKELVKSYQFPDACLECHVKNDPSFELPFGGTAKDRAKLRKDLLQGMKKPPPQGKITDSPFYKDIMSRVKAAENDPNRMPKAQMTVNGEKVQNKMLDKGEIEALDLYLRYVFDSK